MWKCLIMFCQASSGIERRISEQLYPFGSYARNEQALNSVVKLNEIFDGASVCLTRF